MRRTCITAVLTAAALVLGVLVATAAEAGSCGGRVFAPPFKRSEPVSSNCGFLGSRDDTKIYYSWNVGAGSSGKACVEGLGYERLIGPGYRNPYRERWFSLGCGTRGSAAVPWGNVGAVPKVRAESLNVPLGTFVDFRH